jgi:hypothetical protein
VRALPRAPVAESVPASRCRPGPFCASPALNLLVTWSLLFVFFFVLGRVEP